MNSELYVRSSLDLGDLSTPVDFSLGQGELVAITGGIGSGKSSLLRLVAGLIRCRDGVVQFDGEDWDNPDSSTFVESSDRPVAYLPQDYRSLLPADATVCETVGLHRERSEAISLLHSLALGDSVIHRPAATLSNGEAQRAALAVALARHPRLLLLDEPFSSLDRRTSDTIHAWLDGWLHQTGVPTLLVSGDPEDQNHFADRTIELTAGSSVNVKG